MRIDCVTGAFGFSGRFIARHLLDRGRALRTLTNHPDPTSPLGREIDTRRLAFGDPEQLARDLEGVHTLYNTYWVRFDHGKASHAGAVRNTETLFTAAQRAGVRRVVHVSIANATAAPDLPYYRGKARLEETLAGSGLSFAIVRPTVLFGDEGILIHNIAWLLRRLPVFAIAGDGDYRLQPVHVDDLARLCVTLGEPGEDSFVDAAGPEVFGYRELVDRIRTAVGSRAPMLKVPRSLALAAARLLGLLLRDVLITPEELDGLQRDLLVSREVPTGTLRLSDWIADNAATLGARYRSELALHFATAA